MNKIYSISTTHHRWFFTNEAKEIIKVLDLIDKQPNKEEQEDHGNTNDVQLDDTYTRGINNGYYFSSRI